MRFVDTQLQQKHTVSLIYRLQRLFFAACMERKVFVCSQRTFRR
jgi:hypothetical protein